MGPDMTDQRAAFEAHFQLTQRQAWQHKDGSYQNTDVQKWWEGYQAGVAKAALSDLHAAIMNLACNVPGQWSLATQAAYKTGHRDARHAAAELVAAPVAAAAPNWLSAERISFLPAVCEALENFSHDSTHDNAVGVVLAVLTSQK